MICFNMEAVKNTIFVILTVIHTVQSSIICGEEICYGTEAYCCAGGGCCWHSYVYEFWWFWIIWVTVFFLILGCSAAYWRKRWRNRRLAVMASSQYPTYGTVIQTSTGGTTTAVTAPLVQPGVYPTMPPNNYYASPAYTGYAPSALPSYADSEANKNEKPPAYSSA